mmetsp:Transcript_109605/g.285681  ORF Transcript_109605/g.285681 Transcript_109605/m.285681 type:complete len:180 (+) Transcript_109605:96-635(+)
MAAARRSLLSLAALLRCEAFISDPPHWMQKACSGFNCTSRSKPILDYDGERCFCRPHPCWNDNGNLHTCEDEEFPFLAWGYESDGTLMCTCMRWPQVGSVYASEKLCPGEHCDTRTYPILDYEAKTGKCECVPHPCKETGKSYECVKEQFPVLNFEYDEAGKLRCGCKRKYVPPAKGEL